MKVFEYLSEILRRFACKLQMDPRNFLINAQVDSILDLFGDLTNGNPKSKIVALPYLSNIPKNIWETKKGLTACLSILMDNFPLSLYKDKEDQKEMIEKIYTQVFEEIKKTNISKSDITLLRKLVKIETEDKKELIEKWIKKEEFIELQKIVVEVIKKENEIIKKLKRNA